MERFDGDSPINARIKIDYSKDKPKVSFAYPRKKSQFKGSMFMTVWVVWCVLFFIGVETFNGDILDENYNKGELQKFAECAARNPVETIVDYDNVRYDLCKPDYKIWRYKIILILFIGFFAIPPLIYFPFKKKWDKLYPEYMALTTSKKIAKFKPKDVKENYDKKIGYPYYVELPVFSNVVCDFNAEKDFSKYMKEFEIKEYKFVYHRKKRIKFGKIKRKEHEVNEWLWYARWYFSEKPKSGNLEVIFK